MNSPAIVTVSAKDTEDVIRAAFEGMIAQWRAVRGVTSHGKMEIVIYQDEAVATFSPSYRSKCVKARGEVGDAK